MKLYLLTVQGPTGYDCYHQKVVAANSRTWARHLANEKTGDEGKIWTDRKRVMCTTIGVAWRDVKEGVVCEDFNAG